MSDRAEAVVIKAKDLNTPAAEIVYSYSIQWKQKGKFQDRVPDDGSKGAHKQGRNSEGTVEDCF